MPYATPSPRIASLAVSCAAVFAIGLPVTARAANFPPLNDPPTREVHPGKFVWAELFTNDSLSAARFYTGVFGWTAATLDQNGVAYTVFNNGGRPVAGLRQRAPTAERHSARWIPFIAVADVTATLRLVSKAAGEVRAQARRFPSLGSEAIFTDSGGAPVGLIHSSSGDTADAEPQVGGWNWQHLYTKDPKAAGAFYRQVFNYDVLPDDRPGKKEEWVLASGAYNRGSVSALAKTDDFKAGWLGVIRVAKLEETLARVPSLGGEVISSPHEASLGSRFAAVSDPTGGVVGLVEYADNANPVNRP